MGALYPYSLVPVLSVATLLFFTAVRRGPKGRGLALYCLAVALWSGTLILIWVPGWASFAERGAAIGAFAAATFLHAAYDATRQRSYRLVIVAYAVAALLTLGGIVQPGLLYGPRAMVRGPLFWPAMALAVVAATVPLTALAHAYRKTPSADRAPLRLLFFAGVLSYGGGMSNAVLLSGGNPSPLPMLGMLGSLFLTANVIRHLETPDERRVLERSLLYAAVAAFLSAGFLFGVMELVAMSNPGSLGQYRLGAFFLLCMAALAFEPLRQHLQESLTGRVVRNRAPAVALSKALTEQQARADHAESLAELGALASAVAHEVRNPLGVMTALVRQLERDGANPDTLVSLQEQIDRASHFVNDLLAYGRARPLEHRRVDTRAIAELAVSSARQGFGRPTEHVRVELAASGNTMAEADQHQLLQAVIALIDNALLAVLDLEKPRIRVTVTGRDDAVEVTVEDSGDGIPEALTETLFDPFVTSRPRVGPRPGTGLGLSIVRRIVERHQGTITVGRSPLQGARFVISLPRNPAALAPTPQPTAKDPT